jgi:hypothetical protein
MARLNMASTARDENKTETEKLISDTDKKPFEIGQHSRPPRYLSLLT